MDVLTLAIEEEIVYARTCNKGDIKTSFLAINNPDRADANCPHDGRASRISGGLVDFFYLIVLLASWNFCLNSTPGIDTFSSSIVGTLYHLKGSL